RRSHHHTASEPAACARPRGAVTTYADSSALLAVYVTEAFSAGARRPIGALPQLPVTPLHDLAVRHAPPPPPGRRPTTRRDLGALVDQLETDIRANRLRWTPLELAAVFADARILAEAHTARLLCRSLDLLHLAAARALGCRRLISGDERQLKLARALRLAT